MLTGKQIRSFLWVCQSDRCKSKHVEKTCFRRKPTQRKVGEMERDRETETETGRPSDRLNLEIVEYLDPVTC